ncbi:Diaminopimelate epimerase [Allomuricauda ruestringensis DSM 13258]|uniref:Diaminopimelate epimerase n=1 Tax=Allomuricauda ruestringensis (strain DSM 13258 / CIP 107369 / LMG 19739 / B1) TaxID=886377 RepID=G2PQT3_ALLRU|nr:diaminopimelate epimerase [Allomuricauda ruestringensis]AEM69065.1 Diaminopimelate epimerase [Allomuricauda ruestringensis DSM 13258]
MELQFFKYQGTGNDFVIIDNRQDVFPKNNTKLVAELCDRRFGIGADGLILLENDNLSDFKMVYFNADGAESSMCGNGGRCLVAFAHYLGVIEKETTFNAVDGLHHATVEGDIVNLKMIDVDKIHEKQNHSFLDTGSPHHVQLVKELKKFDVQKEGKKLRYGIYGESGSNINFVEQKQDNAFDVRTYERGVEGETFSCGTGVTAVALAMHQSGKTAANEVHIHTIGGDLTISFEKKGGKYSNIFLKGPATQVFKGTIACSI